MPVMDGLQACRLIRQWEAQQQREPLPVIALTASVLDEDKVAAKEAGMQGFASKPIDYAQLSAEIARVLQLDITDTPLVTPTEPASLQLLNTKKAVQLWGSLTHYLPQLEQFLQQQQPRLLQAATELQAGHVNAVQQLAHAIKGVAANLALEQLSKLSAELEQAARQQRTERAAQLLAQIVAIWPDHQRACQQLALQATDVAAERLQRLDDATLTAVLTSLQQALQQHELDDNVLEQLERYSGAHEAMILAVLDAVNDFDFSRALAITKQLQQQITTGQH